MPVYNVAIININLCKIEMGYEAITASGLWSSLLPGGHPKFCVGACPLTDLPCFSDRAVAASSGVSKSAWGCYMSWVERLESDPGLPALEQYVLLSMAILHSKREKKK